MSSPAGWAAVHHKAQEVIDAAGWTMKDFYKRTSISETTFRKMAEGVPLKRTEKIRKFERGLGWEIGSAESVAAGGEPSPAPEPAARPDDIATLTAELRQAIEDGRQRDELIKQLVTVQHEAKTLLQAVSVTADRNADRLERIESFLREAARPRSEAPPRR